MVPGNRSVVSLCIVSAISVHKGEVFSGNNQDRNLSVTIFGLDRTRSKKGIQDRRYDRRIDNKYDNFE